MAKAAAPSDESVENIQLADPEREPLPRLTADDGQGSIATPTDEYDHPSLHSDLAPPPDEVEDDDVSGEEIAEQTDATEPEPTTIAATNDVADTTTNTARDTLTDEDRYYRDLGRRAHAERMAALEAQGRGTQPKAVEEEPDEEVDPELEKIAQRTAKIVQKGIRPLIEHTERMKGMFAQSERRAAVAQDQQVAKSTVDKFLQTNALTRADADLAEYVRGELNEVIDQHLSGFADGQHGLRVDAGKIAALAAQKVAKLHKVFANRAVRQTTQRTAVANATRSTSGGSTPRAGAAPTQPSEAQLRKNMELNLKKAGLR